MATFYTKSKWNSQQIHKRCKNKRHNEYWNKQSHHSVSLTNFSNEYQNNQYNHYEDKFVVNDEYEANSYQTSYWQCQYCAFNNIERDLYCSICKLPFKPCTNSKPKYSSDNITIADYLPSDINDIIHYEDDIDESIQIAIILSLETHEPPINQPQTQVTQDIDSYSHSYPSYNEINLCISKRSKRSNKKWKEQYKLEKLREKKERQQLTNYLRKKGSAFCLPLKSVINPAIYNGIKDKIMETYCKDSLNLSFIGTRAIISKFILSRNRTRSKFRENDFEIVYHGTDSRNTQSIIDNGLIVGGTRGIPMTNGCAYGRGVYCSPEISMARIYENGSLFVCAVRNRMAEKSGSIWVIPNENDIVPLYLASMDNKFETTKATPFPSSVGNKKNIDYKGQNVVRFIPSFRSLNKKKKLERKIRRKWNAYYKINEYK